MKIKQLKKEINGVFIQPKKKYYLGKIKYGTPYFNPINFCNSIIKVKKLKLRSKEEFEEISKKYPYSKEQNKFINCPLVRRSKDWIVNILGYYFWIQIGFPISIQNINLGWKDKYNSPRFEWFPMFQIYLFNYQFCIFYQSPDEKDDDLYYEMILWYLYYSNKNIEEAKNTWNWIDYDTKVSTWNNKYLINE